MDTDQKESQGKTTNWSVMDLGKKREKANIILAEVDGLFHTAEKANQQHSVTYLDIVRIVDRVREHFDNKTPLQINAALDVAVGLCHPKKLEAVALIRKGFSALLAIAGGGALLWGIVTIIALGLTTTTVTGLLWWKITVVTILFGGPIGIALGIAGLALGIYGLSLKSPIKLRAVIALDVIKKGLDNWVKSDLRKSLPEIKWILELTENEFVAFVSLAWHIIDADKVNSQEEMVILDHILSTRKPTKIEVMTGFSISVEESCAILNKSKYADKCFDLLNTIPEADGEVAPEEKEIIDIMNASRK